MMTEKKKKFLIEVPEAIEKALVMEASQEGRTRMKHIEYVLTQHVANTEQRTENARQSAP